MHKKVIRDTVYYYTSVRENGRVKTIYLGRTEEEALRKEEELKKLKNYATSKGKGLLPDSIKFRLPIYLFIAVFIVLGFLFLRGVYVGYLALSGPEKFFPGEKFNGTINLTFMDEEFYPKDTIIEAGIGDQINKMELRQLLVESGIEIGHGEGEYYVIGSGLVGSGEGFGIEGKKKIFPEVGFSYSFLCSYANGTLNETYEEIFSGTCNSSEPYARPIAENLADCSVSIIAGSVHAGNETLNETYITSVIENSSVIILTTYSGILPGFGRGFVSEQEMDAKIEVEKFNLIVPETLGDYVFSVRLVYNETVIKEAVKNITVTNVSAEAGQEMQKPEILENVSEIDVQLPQIRDSDHDGDPDITDCDPKNPEIHHGAEETCNGVDDNCDDVIDEGFDYDNDTYVTCGEKLDCDDSDKEVNPGAKEICDDGKDNNCDGLKDNEDPNCIVCEDKDKDGYDTCHQPIDCDDNNPNVHPKAKEACDNLVDEDCNGFDEVCITLTSVIQLEKITYVKKEVENEISKNKQAKIIIKFKDIPNKSEIEKEIIPQRETKNFVSVTLDELEMIDLVKKFTADDIELIQLDHPIKLALDDVVNQTGVNLVWDLNATGKDQSVCVIDSGIDYNHANLSDKYIGGYDFVNNDNDPMDDYGHGTYVSGIIAGIGPDAKIVAVKVFGNEGSGYESDIIAGIDYCVQNKDAYSISVMLMSFGGWIFNTSCYCDSNLVANESNFAVSQGIFAVAASGNDAGEYLKAPACGSNVTSVGATDKNDSIADFTNIEPLLDLLAPGVHVTSAKMGGGYETKSGTSASAAVVAGIASLVLEKENLAPLDLQYRLRSTGMIIESNGTGYPRIDAYAAATKNTTNNPEEQQGNQCDGTWEGQEPLLTCSTCNGCEDYFCWVYYICLEPPCAGGCPDGCDVESEVCDKDCGAACEIDADCPSDGWYCNGETREHWNYYCDTSYCTGCNCDHTTDDYGENCDTQGGGCGDGWYYCSNAYTRANLNWYCITDDNPGAPCGYTTSGTQNCYDVCADGCASYNSCTDPSGCSVSYCDGYHDCGSYSCNNGCTTTCDQACGATCDQDSDCAADTCSGSCPGCLWNDSSCDSACDCALTQRNPDTTSSRCTGCSQTWNAGGNGDCSGESGCLTDCCGDDSGEGYRSCTKNTSTLSWTCAAANDTCCNAATDCVDPMNNSCATAGTGWNIYGSQTNDTYAYCNTTGGWQDCDDNYAGCGATYCGNASGVKCGAGTGCSAMGEYGDSATKECCGDDSGENYLYRIAHTSMDNGWTTNTSDYACCNTTTDCVRNSVCYPSGTAPLDADGDGDTDYCSSNYWYDCNTDLQCSTGSCVSNDCADYADCIGTLASPCDMCDVDAANVTIQAPGGSTVGPYQMVFSNTEGSICNQYGWYINETWNYSLGYTFCSVEGNYNASVKFHAEGATWVWEYAPSTTIYTVSWDTDQNWCNCKVGATACNGGSCYYSSGLAWESGTNSNCCGDDTGENYTYRIADTTMGSWTTNTSDRVCCNASSKCVANGLCYANQSIADVDNNGDTDYCLVGLNGSWYDCNSTADCLTGYRCENRDCVADVNITLNSPVSGYNTTYSITFNATVVASPDLANVSLYGNWSASGWHRNETNSSGTNNTNYIFAKSLASYADGYYKWAIHACNSYGGCKFSENRTFRLDATPPTPNPATIVFVNSTYYANMTVNATLASDAGIGGVEYLFNETTGSSGSTNSSWQSSRLYTDESLSSNTSYCYIVQYRDALNNTGTASSQACNYTLAEPPTITSVLCGSTAGNYYCNVTFSMGSNPAGTLNYIDETTGSSGGSDRDWNSSTAMYQDTGLATGTQYCYRIMAKNANNFNTSYSSTTCDYTSYLLITETVNPNTTYPSQTVYVYGHINLSNGTDVINSPFNMWLNGSALSMRNLTAYGSYNNNFNFIHTNSNDWDGGTFTNTTYDSENVTLNTTQITADASLVGLWHLNNDSSIGENGTYFVDSSGRGNNGTCDSGSGYCPAFSAIGKLRGSFTFDGSNDYVNVSDNAILNPSNVTVMAWIKTSTTTDNIFVRKYNSTSPWYGYALRVNSPAASKLGAWMGGTYWVGGNTNINNSQWHHVAASCNGTNIILYVDGAQDNSSSQACNASAVAGTTLYIGSFAAGSYPYNGTLDEVAIYNRSLTAAEIGALYQKQKCGYYYCNGTFESEIVDAGAVVQWKNLSWTAPYRYGDDLPNNKGVESSGVNMTDNVLLMHFNNQSAYGENSTLAYDFSGTGNNGTINGSTWTSGGKLGAGALVFDGSNDRINVSDSNSLDITGTITIEAWIYPRSFGLNDLGRILQKDLAYALYISNNSAYPKSIVFVLWNSTEYKILYTPYTTIDTNKWQHIAALYNGSYMSLYVNSVLINSTAWTATINTTATPLYIGDRYDLTRVFDGYLDEIAIYNRSLSYSEIYNHYMRGLKMQFRVKTCRTSDCSDQSTMLGPDLSGSTYFTNSSGNSLANFTNVTRYFQWGVYFENFMDSDITPYLQDATMNYTAVVTDASGNYNYSFAAPTVGTYPVVVNATYSGSYGNNSMNLTVLNVTLSITETLDPSTAQASSTVFVYGRMNLSNGTIASNYPLNIWLNGSLLTTRNVTAYGTYVSGLNFTQTNNWNSGSNYYFWNATYDSENVTLNTTETLNDPNAVLIYHLNNDSSLGENNTHFVDVSSGGNNGTCSVAGCPTLTSLGKLRKAYTFDGSDDYIYTNDSFSNPLNFTISVWFRTSSASGTKIVGFEDAQSGTGGTTYDRHIYMGTDGKIYFSWYTGSIVEITSTTTLNNGAWHHAVGAYNSSGGGRLYIDGVLQGSNTGTAQNYAGYWRIGSYKLNAWTNAVDGYFNGVIDEVAIYNRTLTQAEIQQTYENQRCGYYYCNGSYRSNIFDAGTNVEWKNISWTEPYPYGDEVVAESATQGLYHFSANEGVQKSAESGLTGLWHLNDNTLTDSSGYGNTCTAESSLDCTNDRGVFDDGCDFDGTNSYALNCGTSSSIRPTGALSISAWIYPLTMHVDGDKPVVTTYHYSVTMNDTRGYTFAKAWESERFSFIVYNSSGNSSIAYMNDLLNISNGKWVHVVGVYNPGQYIKLYVNGTIVKNTTTNVINAIAYSTEAVKMGKRSDGGQYPWNGSIDEVIIWNRTLSDAEVWDLYTRGRAADSSNNANNAHLGGSLNASGVIGNALSFDGSNDYVETADNNILDNVQNGSVEAWFKTTNGNNGVIVGYTTSYALSSNFVWRVRLNVTEMAWNYGGAAGNWNTINGTTKMNDGKWHHVVFTSNGVTRNKIYLDGVEETTTFTSSGSSTDDKNWTYGVDYVSTYNHHVNIGALMRSAPQGYFNGQIDEVVIYNRTLSASEVYNHYMRGLQLKFRMTTCRTSDCSDQSTMLGPDLSGSTYFTNSSGNSLANFTNVTRYFQWRAYFENFDNSGITPYLQDFTVNYTGILTNASGYYNYSFTAPATEGTYPIVVNSTFLNIYGNNSQNLIVLNYIINGGSGTGCNATSKCLLIMNSTDSAKARMDKSGNVDVKGNYISSQASLSPPTGSFIIKDSGGNTVLFINRTGDLATKGTFYMQSSPAPSGNNDFIIKNSTGSVVGYIDGGTGSMYFKGVLHYNSNF